MDRLKQAIPTALSLEELPNSLASLTMTESLKEATETVVQQWGHNEAFDDLAQFGIHPIRQLFFHGPPGNGKTTACQLIAKKLDVPLYRVRCEQIVDSYVGQTAKNVGNILNWLSSQGMAVVLFDEFESMFSARGGSGAADREVSSGMTTLWQRLDRWKKQQLFVFATNMEEMIDSAMLSRFEMQLYFGGPSFDQCRNVIQYWAETLHEYGGDVWSKKLLDELDKQKRRHEACGYVSFRKLWQAIHAEVVSFVSKGGAK